MKERFEIMKLRSYYFQLVTPNNELIGYDTDFNTKEQCEQNISDVRAYSQNVANFFYWQNGVDLQWCFHLRKGSSKAAIILHSDKYKTRDACLNGIYNVRKYAPTAEIVDKI